MADLDASRDALAIAIAATEGDRLAMDALLGLYPGERGMRRLGDGLVRVIRTMAGQRIADAGQAVTEEQLARSLRELLQGAFAEVWNLWRLTWPDWLAAGPQLRCEAGTAPWRSCWRPADSP